MISSFQNVAEKQSYTSLLPYLNETSLSGVPWGKTGSSFCWIWAAMLGFNVLEDIWLTVLEVKILTEKTAIIGTTNLVFSR